MRTAFLMSLGIRMHRNCDCHCPATETEIRKGIEPVGAIGKNAALIAILRAKISTASQSARSTAMKRAAIELTMVLILTCTPVANYASSADAQEEQISARDLKTLEIPGKVLAVLWTVRPERCTLQIVYPSGGQIAQATGDYPKPGSHHPSVQAWLLRADGSAIPSIGRTEPGAHAKNLRQPFGAEVLIAFPRLADTQAVAVALRVDDDFLIERLATSRDTRKF